MNDALFVVLMLAAAGAFLTGKIYLSREAARAWRVSADPLGHTVYPRPPREARRGYRKCRIRIWGNTPGTTVELRAGDATVWLSRVQIGPATRGSRPVESLAVLAQTGTRQLPSMSIHPRTSLERLAVLFGGSDIRMEGDDTFTAMYRVEGRDEREIRRVLTPDLRAWFCAHAGKGSMEARGGYAMVFVRDVDPTPEHLGAWSERLQAALRALGVLRA